MCRIAGTFACDQLIANGKLETKTTTVFGFTANTCFTNCSWPSVRLSRSRPSRPSLGDVQGRVSPPSADLTQSCAISGPHVGSLPTTTIAASAPRAAFTAAFPNSSTAYFTFTFGPTAFLIPASGVIACGGVPPYQSQ